MSALKAPVLELDPQPILCSLPQKQISREVERLLVDTILCGIVDALDVALATGRDARFGRARDLVEQARREIRS
jgi:hypothetical protein